jgi:hypothetical protein
MSPLLVIGIGNPLRGDDGVGPRLAAEAEALAPRPRRGREPDLAVRAVQQLTPELAPEVAEARAVLFIDAWLAPPTIHVPPVGPRLVSLGLGDPVPLGDGSPAMLSDLSHHLDPVTLLRLADLLYSGRPRAHELLGPAEDFPHRRRFSRGLRQRLPQARDLLSQWIADLSPGSTLCTS